MSGDSIKPLAEFFQRQALLGSYAGVVLGHDGQQDHLLIQHLVVFEMVQQGHRDPFGIHGHENGRPGNPVGIFLRNVLQEKIHGQAGGQQFS